MVDKQQLAAMGEHMQEMEECKTGFKVPDAKPEFCESVMRSIPEPEAKPTIEQLAADYRNAKDYANRKQQEADAAKLVAEVERLTLSLNHANINHELFERQYYLEKDKCEDMQGEVERLRSTLQQCVDALYIAHKFCGNHTADECGDEIAIPISDALVAAAKIVAPSNLGVKND